MIKKIILVLIVLLYVSSSYAKDLLIIGAEWCPACNELKIFLSEQDNLSSKYNIEYIDYDTNKDLMKKLKIKKLPTSIIFDDNGKIQSKNIGYDSVKYKKWLNEN